MPEKENTVLVEECGGKELFYKQLKNSFLTRSGTWKINNGLLTCLFQIYQSLKHIKQRHDNVVETMAQVFVYAGATH